MIFMIPALAFLRTRQLRPGSSSTSLHLTRRLIDPLIAEHLSICLSPRRTELNLAQFDSIELNSVGKKEREIYIYIYLPAPWRFPGLNSAKISG
ncbi:unnamed protein product [Tuber melanosporum]|uniref:(Perigord truffle) hypothetical protein n=1 Tax=Tuber melanosporum (strain Mel28) TaxID=656061 RepID=D5G6X9_TUBMM|nr:uncharacterized protein GSTUM_00002377001 [Tuber melanosporum]CAZ80272.1 unnamed protein product [Tuber melanosporum]